MCWNLVTAFPYPSSIAIVLTSPLKRALQTTLAGFSHALAPDRDDNGHEFRNVRLMIDRDLQERSDLPCDTGSEQASLEEAFSNVDLNSSDEDWFLNTGMYAADEKSVALRARIFREELWNIADSVRKEQPISTSRELL